MPENDKPATALHETYITALRLLETCTEFAGLVPEVRTNLVFARPEATEPGDVLAVDGRITVVDGRPKAAGRPKFGASDHMARLVIELHRLDSTVRAGINFASTPKLIAWLEEYCSRHAWVFSVIDRGREPEDLQEEEQPSIPWKAEEAVRAAGGRVPKLFHETAATGKEPLTFLVGPDPVAVAEEACAIARAWSQHASPRYCTRWAPPLPPTGKGDQE